MALRTLPGRPRQRLHRLVVRGTPRVGAERQPGTSSARPLGRAWRQEVGRLPPVARNLLEARRGGRASRPEPAIRSPPARPRGRRGPLGLRARPCVPTRPVGRGPPPAAGAPAPSRRDPREVDRARGPVEGGGPASNLCTFRTGASDAVEGVVERARPAVRPRSPRWPSVTSPAPASRPSTSQVRSGRSRRASPASPAWPVRPCRRPAVPRVTRDHPAGQTGPADVASEATQCEVPRRTLRRSVGPVVTAAVSM